MKRSMLLVLALTAAAYAVLFVYCGTALGLAEAPEQAGKQKKGGYHGIRLQNICSNSVGFRQTSPGV